MPIYEFECGQCGSRSEELVKSGTSAPACPSCKSSRTRRRLSPVSPPGRVPRGAKVGDSESQRREREAARSDRLADAKKGEEVVMSSTSEQRREQLVAVYNEAAVCEKCPLSATRTRVVFGSGNADADLMFVGEAPGAEEDRQGLPFVGRAGALLTELLEGIDLRREDVFICNTLKCRPPGNRDPQPIEIETCEPYLAKQLELIEPRVVCTLGNFATKLLTASRTGISKVRGAPQVHRLGGRTVFVMPLFHPAAALRTPSVADTLRSDFAKLPELLKQAPPDAAPAATPEPAGTVPESPEAEPALEADQLGLFG